MRMPGLVSNQTTSFFTLPFRKHKRVYEMNPPDETYNVTYMGNVLTIIGKGEASIEKPLDVIWRTYTSKKGARREVSMKLSITRSGLKADTKEGTSNYVANRVTYCAASPQYPRIFCWVYKHEGKRMKPDLRCHAVLCRKTSDPLQICTKLQKCLQEALLEYKREKMTIEKARKNSLSGGIGPRRKILLQTGSLNFRSPMSRSKSAPRLGSIDEEDEKCEDNHNGIEDEESEIDCMSYHNTPIFNDTESTSDGTPNRDIEELTKTLSEMDETSSSISSACSVTSSSPSFASTRSRNTHDTVKEFSISCSNISSSVYAIDLMLSNEQMVNKSHNDTPIVTLSFANEALSDDLKSRLRITENELPKNHEQCDASALNFLASDIQKFRLNHQNSFDDSQASSSESTMPDNSGKLTDV